MKKLLFLLLVANCYSINIMGSAPFCKVDRQGINAFCYYYTLDACEAASGYGYFCMMR